MVPFFAAYKKPIRHKPGSKMAKRSSSWSFIFDDLCYLHVCSTDIAFDGKCK